MRAFGFIARALVIEVIAVGAIIWFADGRLTAFEAAAPGEPSTVQVAQSNSTAKDRTSYVRSKLERLASELRTGANQLVDETLATWFGK